MKKIWIIMLMICSIYTFSACSDDDNNPTPKNPVSNVKIPATAEIGTEIIISGTGFSSTAQFTFKDTESSVDVTECTIVSSGVTITIPMSLTPGQYTLILKQNGEWELGVIELTAASLPIIGLEIPAEGFIGQPINISGNGYNETSKVYLETPEGSRTELTITDYQSGLTCTLPSNLTTGNYNLILTQDGGEWILTEEFEVVKMKRLVKIDWINDLSELMPEYIVETKYEISYTNNTPLYFKYIYNECEINYNIDINNEQITLSADETENDAWEEAFYEGYSKKIILKINNDLAQENITTFYNWSKDVNMSGIWTYTDQYMKSYEGKGGFSQWEYTYVSNNLTDISGYYTFEYSDVKYSRPGVDIASLLSEINSASGDLGWLYAAFTGLLGERSTELPDKITIIDPYEESTATYDLIYTYDEDQYVTSVSYEASYYGMGMVTYRIDFTYEEVQ